MATTSGARAWRACKQEVDDLGRLAQGCELVVDDEDGRRRRSPRSIARMRSSQSCLRSWVMTRPNSSTSSPAAVALSERYVTWGGVSRLVPVERGLAAEQVAERALHQRAEAALQAGVSRGADSAGVLQLLEAVAVRLGAVAAAEPRQPALAERVVDRVERDLVVA